MLTAALRNPQIRLLPSVLLRVLPLTALTLLGIWLLASHLVRATISDALERALHSAAADAAETTGAKLRGVVEALENLAANDFIVNGLEDVQERGRYLPIFFQSLRLTGSIPARVTLADYRGRTIVSNIDGNDFEDAPWVEGVMADQTYIDFSSSGLVAAAPVRTFGRAEGVLVVELPPASLSSLLAIWSTARSVEIWADGDTLLHSSESWHLAPAAAPQAREAWISASAPIPGFPSLRLILQERESIAFAPARRLDTLMLSAIVLSLLAITAGIAATAYFAKSPLDRLIAEIDKIGKDGDVTYRLPLFGAVEFRGLSNSLNSMLQNLENTTTSCDYFDAVLNSINEMIIVTDWQGRVQLANDATTKTTGRSFDEILENGVASILSGSAIAVNQPTAGETVMVEDQLVTASGDVIPVQVSISPLSDNRTGPAQLIYVISDISERKETERELAALAQFDILTGLANRSLFQSRLEDALAQARRTGQVTALMMLDLDRFKEVNDTLGHPVGDELLKEVAARLKRVTRETDTVARLGGDEFAIIVTNLKGLRGASDVAQKLVDSIAEPFRLHDHEVHTAASIGISVSPPEQPDPSAMFNHADFALYQAKSFGRGAWQFFDEEMNRLRIAQKALEVDLQRAIKGNQFLLHYQPKLDAISGEVRGVEALIRWQHPDRGVVAPSEFIPVAESTGLIGELSAWILWSACAQHVAWLEAGLGEIPIAINLSATQFKDKKLSEKVLNITAQHGVSPANIELEITESMIIENVDEVSQQIKDLHNLGFHICIDDFGTGYSSLAYLKRFPIDALKIDRSFIMNISEDSDDAVIVKAMVALAHSLKIDAVAEGVETHEQLTFLRRCNCPQVQGYFFSRPVPADEFVAWRATHMRRPAIPSVEDIAAALQ